MKLVLRDASVCSGVSDSTDCNCSRYCCVHVCVRLYLVVTVTGSLLSRLLESSARHIVAKVQSAPADALAGLLASVQAKDDHHRSSDLCRLPRVVCASTSAVSIQSRVNDFCRLRIQGAICSLSIMLPPFSQSNKSDVKSAFSQSLSKAMVVLVQDYGVHVLHSQKDTDLCKYFDCHSIQMNAVAQYKLNKLVRRNRNFLFVLQN